MYSVTVPCSFPSFTKSLEIQAFYLKDFYLIDFKGRGFLCFYLFSHFKTARPIINTTLDIGITISSTVEYLQCVGNTLAACEIALYLEDKACFFRSTDDY